LTPGSRHCGGPRRLPRTPQGTTRNAVVALAAVVACVGLAGCGGSSSGSGHDLYTLSATRSCLDKAGYATAVVKDQFLPGSGGNLRVHVTKVEPLLNPTQRGGNAETGYVFIVFGKDPAAAVKTQNKALSLAVQSFQHEQVLMTRAALKKGVGLSKNVFFYSSTGALSAAERTKVSDCLR
jgi:hypothetical protein